MSVGKDAKATLSFPTRWYFSSFRVYLCGIHHIAMMKKGEQQKFKRRAATSVSLFLFLLMATKHFFLSLVSGKSWRIRALEIEALRRRRIGAKNLPVSAIGIYRQRPNDAVDR